jgi:hypothetical protein
MVMFRKEKSDLCLSGASPMENHIILDTSIIRCTRQRGKPPSDNIHCRQCPLQYPNIRVPSEAALRVRRDPVHRYQYSTFATGQIVDVSPSQICDEVSFQWLDIAMGCPRRCGCCFHLSFSCVYTYAHLQQRYYAQRKSTELPTITLTYHRQSCLCQSRDSLSSCRHLLSP